MSEMMVRLTERAALAFREQAIEPWQGFTPQGVVPPFDYERFLRALLLELREPTEAMWDAHKLAEEVGISHWHAMIDRILE